MQTIKMNENLIFGFDLLNDHTINLHIVKNEFLRGRNALNYFDAIVKPLFYQTRVRKIMVMLPETKEYRHIRIMAYQAGFKKEGLFKSFSKIKDKYYDTLILSLNKEGE